jgi:UDP-N-acetylglucosamine--N-acetylmuramyl-(pentapeptide) pyrophosphoryl-undecaprenol N-acetylglucosamine transferase
LKVLQGFRPDVVLGTGGYVCGPVVFAANRLGIPVVLHEQNAFPGRANRLLSRKARFVCISFQDSGRNFPKGVETLQTGYPVRSVFFSTDRDESRRALGIPDETPFVLALGGSQGARSINRAVTAMLKAGPAPSGCRVLLATGDGLFVEASTESEPLKGRTDEFRIVPYLEEPHVAMAAADLIVCRAGAGACAEIAALGKPSVLVPYPFAANDHQTFNARSLTDIGAAVLCADADFDGSALRRFLDEILPDSGRRLRMAASAKRLAREDAADRIVDCLFKAAGKAGEG